MANSARLRLLVAAFALLLSLVPVGQAGSATAPEITDPDNDREVDGTGLSLVPLPLAEAAEITAGWVSENATALFFHIQVAGDLEGQLGGPGAIGEPFGILALYDYEFHFTRLGADLHAAARVSDDTVGDGIEPDELATDVSVDGNVINMTVPKSALPDLAPDEELTALEVTATGTLTGITPLNLLGVITDEATGTTPYVVQLGLGGTATDRDGDGLPDAWEQTHFGNLNQTGSGDPDKDGLNNTAENGKGTDPKKADTDGDGLNDKADPFPLDPKKPGGADSDNDGLPDAWEQENFGDLDETGSGDPDDDGLTNAQENAAGTDPNEADTDGGGTKDGDDSAPLDPQIGDLSPGDSKVDVGNVRPELYAGSAMFAAAATFILLGLAKGL